MTIYSLATLLPWSQHLTVTFVTLAILKLEYTVIQVYYLEYSLLFLEKSLDWSHLLDDVPDYQLWTEHLIDHHGYVQITHQAFRRIIQCCLLSLVHLYDSHHLLFDSIRIPLLFLTDDNLIDKGEYGLCNHKDISFFAIILIDRNAERLTFVDELLVCFEGSFWVDCFCEVSDSLIEQSLFLHGFESESRVTVGLLLGGNTINLRSNWIFNLLCHTLISKLIFKYI